MHASRGPGLRRPQGVVSPIGRTASRGAAEIDRESKAAAEQLREVLQSQPPWSREVETHRQNARNLFLTLLFAHPLSTHSQSLEPLWHHTTYILISQYRAITSNLETSLPQNTGARKGKPQNSPQHIELKKVLTRFRQLLSSEEAFYRSLISRLVGFYQLQPLARDLLATISIGCSEPVENGGTKDGLSPELSAEERREKLGLVYKALICLGDLERYREQYEERTRRETREKRVNLVKLSERFNKSWSYYEVARALVPDDGSAFNQLAVISTYLSDDFLCVYFYFRALAVRHAFKNIGEILDKFLRKIMEKWPGARGQRDDGENESVKDEVEQVKADLLVLSAILYRRAGFSALSKLEPQFLGSLGDLLRERQLPSEAIVRMTVIVIGTHWHTRQSASIAAPTEDPKQVQRRHEAENVALRLLLGVYGQFLTVSANEIDDALRARANGSAVDDTDTELHQYISAVLRRLLPSLRIFSKWLKLHLEYVMRVQRTDGQTRMVDDFWKAFMRLAVGLVTLFPIDQLPSLAGSLEEDVDMRGFIPLFKGMGTSRDGCVEEEHVFHPNEEQLMRIADLQVDAKLLAQTKSGASALGPPNASVPLPLPSVGSFGLLRDRTDDMASVSTETEDDPVNLAMRATLGSSSVDEEEMRGDDDEEEIILWAGNGNQASGHSQSTPVQSHAQQTPMNHRPQTSTAYDLLNNLMLDTPSPGTYNQSRAPAPVHNPQPLAQSSPGILFGGDVSGSSIWTMTREESGRGVPRQQAAVANIWNDAPPQSTGLSAALPSAHGTIGVPAQDSPGAWGRTTAGQSRPGQDWVDYNGTGWQGGQGQRGQYPR